MIEVWEGNFDSVVTLPIIMFFEKAVWISKSDLLMTQRLWQPFNVEHNDRQVSNKPVSFLEASKQEFVWVYVCFF
jgi:hypothetical protein